MIVQCQDLCEVLNVIPNIFPFWSRQIDIILKDSNFRSILKKNFMLSILLLNNKKGIRKISWPDLLLRFLY